MEYRSLPEGQNPFWFEDGLHNPHVKGRGTPIYTGYTPPIRAAEFVMGYPDEQGAIASQPRPDALRLSGTSAAMRNFHTNVASFRTFLRESASGPEDEELLAAKLVGRCRIGAPLALAPDRMTRSFVQTRTVIVISAMATTSQD